MTIIFSSLSGGAWMKSLELRSAAPRDKVNDHTVCALHNFKIAVPIDYGVLGASYRCAVDNLSSHTLPS